MLDFIDNRELTPEETYRLRWAYDCLQIPLPKSNEYYNGNTKVTFINDAAFTLRLQQTRRVSLVRHPHVARPVGSITLSKKWRLDVVQGGETSVSPEEAKRVEKSISQDGFIVDDISGKTEERNCLRIPKKTEDYPDGFSMGYDFWDLRPSKISTQIGKTPFKFLIRSKPFAWLHDTRPQKGQLLDIQDIEYGDLRDAFMDAWKKAKSGKTIVVPDAMDRFWKSCIQAKEERRIQAGWLEETTRMQQDDQNRTIRFKNRLKEASPAFA